MPTERHTVAKLLPSEIYVQLLETSIADIRATLKRYERYHTVYHPDETDLQLHLAVYEAALKVHKENA